MVVLGIEVVRPLYGVSVVLVKVEATAVAVAAGKYVRMPST